MKLVERESIREIATKFNSPEGIRICNQLGVVFCRANSLIFGANQFINNILGKLLAPTRVLNGIGPTQYIFFKRDKVLFTRFDRSTDAIVPGGVTGFYQFGQT